MDWAKTDRTGIRSASGYVIRAFKASDGWIYCAFAPAIEYQALKEKLQVRYEIGERVPMQREHLGCYRGDGALDQAKDACERHEGGRDERQQTAAA